MHVLKVASVRELVLPGLYTEPDSYRDASSELIVGWCAILNLASVRARVTQRLGRSPFFSSDVRWQFTVWG